MITSLSDEPSEGMMEAVARAICKSRTCLGIDCCEWPSQMGKRHQCSVAKGLYSDAAHDAIAAIIAFQRGKP